MIQYQQLKPSSDAATKNRWWTRAAVANHKYKLFSLKLKHRKWFLLHDHDSDQDADDGNGDGHGHGDGEGDDDGNGDGDVDGGFDGGGDGGRDCNGDGDGDNDDDVMITTTTSFEITIRIFHRLWRNILSQTTEIFRNFLRILGRDSAN